MQKHFRLSMREAAEVLLLYILAYTENIFISVGLEVLSQKNEPQKLDGTSRRT
mgnify:CR=1 FL=1